MRHLLCFGCGYPRPTVPADACDNCARPWNEPPTDDEFWNQAVLNSAHWLFYGDLDEHFGTFMAKVFGRELRAWGFRDAPMEPDFAVAYWLFLSELVALDFADYGTSPRGAWLTEDGERFKRIVLERHAAGTLDFQVEI